MRWRHASGELDLSVCRVMGIVNRTPDSFYDGGRMELEDALAYGVALADEGADLLDLGAVKAGPGDDVDVDEETERLVPLVEALAQRVAVPISVETSRPPVARAALDAGASIINDVSGELDAAVATLCADHGAGLIVMHSGGQIRGRPRNPRYADVVTEVADHLEELARLAEAAGVATASIVIDPGLDFGKTTFHSLELMRRLDEIVAAGRPVLIAASRKDVIGETLDLPPADRLGGSLALAAIAALKGAAIVRAHDVVETSRVVQMTQAVASVRPPVAPVRGLWE